MDPLVEIPMEKWNKLQDELRKVWPLNAPGYYALHVNLKYTEVRECFKFKVYCPYGDITNGFVATSFKDALECVIWPISEDTSKLEEALIKTNIIDWTKKVCIDTVTSAVLKLIQKIKPSIDFSYYYIGAVKTYFLDKCTKHFEHLMQPSNTYLAAVGNDFIRRVDDKWPYRHEESARYFSILATNGLSYGLYSNGKLLAWVFLNEYHFLCHLYCEEDYRRRGYAEYLMKYVINHQLDEGNDLYGYVVEGNEKSAALFVKLGFNIIDKGAYLYVQK